MSATLGLAEQYIESGQFAHLMGVNADKLLQIRAMPWMADVVERSEVVNADGASMVLAAKWLGVNVPERVAGIDLMQHLCALAVERQYSIFLLGARPDVVHGARQNLESQYAGIRIVGARDGYFEEGEYPQVAQMLRALKPDIVFVGVTSPKKEQLIEFFRRENISSVFMGVGGSFDVISGLIPRAPAWMQRTHLEWLFRMLREPRRLGKRYIIGNIRFLIMLTTAKIANIKDLGEKA
ncbi:WecB/TagA/CpsF family glycosyltransferase [Microbacterium sp. NPDC055312]